MPHECCVCQKSFRCTKHQLLFSATVNKSQTKGNEMLNVSHKSVSRHIQLLNEWKPMAVWVKHAKPQYYPLSALRCTTQTHSLYRVCRNIRISSPDRSQPSRASLNFSVKLRHRLPSSCCSHSLWVLDLCSFHFAELFYKDCISYC